MGLFYYVFSKMLTMIAIGMHHYKGPFLLYYISPTCLVTPIGSSANAGMGMVLQQKLPNNRMCSQLTELDLKNWNIH